MIVKAFRNNEEIALKLIGTKGYRNSNVKIHYICDICGRECETTYKTLKSSNKLKKQYCKVCKTKMTCQEKYGVDNPMLIPEIANKLRLVKRKEFSDVKKAIEDKNYKLLSTESEYVNSKSKLKMECSRGHIINITPASLSLYSCRKCEYERLAREQRNDIDKLRESAKSEGYELITEKYSNNSQKLKLICPEGHVYYITWSSWFSGKHRCPICFHKALGNKQKLSYDFVNEAFKNRGFELLSKTYDSAFSHLDYICPKGHKGKIAWFNFQQGHGCNSCPKVKSNISKPELELYDLIKSHFPDTLHNDRLLINPYEIDILVPSRKMAVEYCGLYWHSELNGKDKHYHLNKLNLCKDKGYNLIIIFEDEWLYKKEIVISRLKNIFGVSDNKRIHARQCDIREISYRESSEFIDRNHLQGKSNDKIRLGAFFRNDLVSVMTFGKLSISKGGKAEEDVYELNRFCSDYKYNVTGIASKLLKGFTKNFKPKKIISYSDRRWSTGNLYKILGFTHSHSSNPSYWYFINDVRFHRFNFRKNVLKRKLETFNSHLTEWRNMVENKYNRIWDCGNDRWEFVP